MFYFLHSKTNEECITAYSFVLGLTFFFHSRLQRRGPSMMVEAGKFNSAYAAVKKLKRGRNKENIRLTS